MIEPASLPSPDLAGRFFTTSAIWEACNHDTRKNYYKKCKIPALPTLVDFLISVPESSLYWKIKWYVGVGSLPNFMFSDNARTLEQAVVGVFTSLHVASTVNQGFYCRASC